MPDNGSIQKKGAHEMAHGRPVQITEHTTVTELQPSLSDVVCANKKLQIGFIVALVVLALLSGFVARPHFADTKTWDSTIEVIDQKKGNVLALTTSCVALSAGITALPGDTGTPVAEQLAQLSGNLGIVLAVLYLEKYLLLTDGASSLVTSVTSGAKQMTDEIVQQVTDLIEGVIVMIVTSCVIPLLVLVAFLWLGHVLLGIDISGPANYLTGRFLSAPSKHAKKSGQTD